MDRATLLKLDRETLVELVLHLVGEQATVIAALQEQVAALQRENAALRARLGQNSSNFSRPLSSDPPNILPKQRAVPSGLGVRGTLDEGGSGPDLSVARVAPEDVDAGPIRQGVAPGRSTRAPDRAQLTSGARDHLHVESRPVNSVRSE